MYLLWLQCTENGSATCKARHTRCDEKTPVCSNCQRLGLQCRPSELITQSTWSSILSTESASGNEIKSASTPNKILALPCPSAARETSKGSSSEPSSSLTTGNRGSATTQSCRSQLRPFPSGIFVELNDEIAFLFNTFRGGLTTWMDVFDHDRTYEREVTRRALHSNFLLRCICAFTARHLSMLVSGELWFPIASRYYGEGISASSMGMDKANFFIYVRHEITIAISNEVPPQFDPGRWNITKPGPSAAEDRVANYLMLLLGHIVNLIYQNNVSPVDRERLKIQVDEWYDSTTEEFRGIEYGDVSENGMPKIFFPVPLSGELRGNSDSCP
ncbi:Zn(II)2Cys6 transcription factor domain-containing protein [Aspergillus fischeri NRRL 181]|uniref:C6 zinc finger domain protein n=1 Tax=Neosartorya fischeri (strain ATCC 1020 / DSM 3700 / CBS 544.65 / FGSC A1164 / JCM 1740 / NRRL 181 / WB 181) TaxID=331117 RepID=A1DBR9_NEOFI|nr:C6 zinc finger domain protein [Aspergillus fischeri NRRL 181]EAW20309.1 C6 zinc finger domain protein [Aspergillus fischeri NRRL 181]